MWISREEYLKKISLIRRLIYGFMCLGLLLPVTGILALLLGVIQPGDGKGSATKTEVILILAAACGLVLFMWKLALGTLNWIVKGQMALLFGTNQAEAPECDSKSP